MANYKYYIQTDIVKAYWSVSLKKEQRKLFTCVDPITKNTYQYSRMQKWLKSSSHLYQNIAEQSIYRKIDDEFYAYYIDDRCLFINNFDNLFKLFDILLSNYQENNMKLNKMKRKFFA